MKQFDDAISAHAKALWLEQQRAEIERAVKNVKRSAWDKRFRREWYRGTWRIGRMNERSARTRRDWGGTDERR